MNKEELIKKLKKQSDKIVSLIKDDTYRKLNLVDLKQTMLTNELAKWESLKEEIEGR